MGERGVRGVGLPDYTVAELEYWGLRPPQQVVDCGVVAAELCRAVNKLNRDLIGVQREAQLGSVQSLLAPGAAGGVPADERTGLTPEPQREEESKPPPSRDGKEKDREMEKEKAAKSQRAEPSPLPRVPPAHSRDDDTHPFLRLSPPPPGSYDTPQRGGARRRVVASARITPLPNAGPGHRYAPAMPEDDPPAPAPQRAYRSRQNPPVHAFAFASSQPAAAHHRYAPAAATSRVSEGSVAASEPSEILGAVDGKVAESLVSGERGPMDGSEDADASEAHAPTESPSPTKRSSRPLVLYEPSDHAVAVLGDSETSDNAALRRRVHAALDRFEGDQATSCKRQYWATGL